MTWTIAGDAAGVDQLAVGKVMLVTGLAVGRVVDMRPAGDDQAVTLIPVALTDVIRDGELSGESMPLGAPMVQVAPDMPGAEVDLTGSDLTTPAHFPEELGALPTGTGDMATGDRQTASLVTYTADSGYERRPTFLSDDGPELHLGAADVTPLCCSDRFGGRFYYEAKGTKLRIDYWLTLQSPKASYSLIFKRGVMDLGQLSISGITGLHVEIDGRSSSGYAGNFYKSYYFPVNFAFPVSASSGAVGSGTLPLSINLNEYWHVVPYFQDKSAVLKATGDYVFNDDTFTVTWRDGALTSAQPTDFKPITKLGDTITGLGIKATLVRFNVMAKVCICSGPFLWSKGLYYGVGNYLEVSNDSALEAAFGAGNRCIGRQWKFYRSVGLGRAIPAEYAGLLTKRLGNRIAEPIADLDGPHQLVILWDKNEITPPGLERCVRE